METAKLLVESSSSFAGKKLSGETTASFARTAAAGITPLCHLDRSAA
jgi:hypothetical protein